MHSYFDARDSKERLAGEFPAVTRGSFRFSGSLCRELAVCWASFDGTLGAADRYVVTRLRTKCSVLALIVGLLAATAGPVFAHDRHPVCETKQHDCGKTAKISSCCCGDLGQLRDASVPAQARTELTKDAAVALA